MFTHRRLQGLWLFWFSGLFYLDVILSLEDGTDSEPHTFSCLYHVLASTGVFFFFFFLDRRNYFSEFLEPLPNSSISVGDAHDTKPIGKTEQ